MIDLSAFHGDRIAVLGLGKTGLSAAHSLMEAGANVLAWDDKEESRRAAEARGIIVTDLNTVPPGEFDYLFLSPGIPHSFPAPHPVVKRMKDAGLAIVSDIELLVRADPAAPIIGITGTNGKSTTTALIGHILKQAGRRCAIGGNLGPVVLDFEQMGAAGTYVLELSSYQLELTSSLAPDIGVLLNITPDHLDRHGGMEGYVAAKRSLFRKGQKKQTAIIGIDDDYCRAIARDLETGGGFDVVTLSIGHGPATVMVETTILKDTRNRFTTDLAALPALPGCHNWQNAAAAYAAAVALGIDNATIVAALRSFPGLDHRQSRVAEIDGVAYVNDSKATNADAAEKALACYDNIYWIAGGLPKEGGLNGLESLMPRIRHAFLIGKAADDFAAWLEGKARYTKCGTLDKAVAAAHGMAHGDHLPGAVVLLSPACASWDQFQSFEHRGQVFAELVRELAKREVAA